MKRTLAIGDIHGCSTALETLAKEAAFSKEDELVFLGDYIDRGPDSKKVIDYLIRLQDEGYDVKCIRGNHEVMMEEARKEGGRAAMSWLRFGGEQTLQSYDAKDFGTISAEHWSFLENLLPYYETESHIFVHAGAIAETPMEEQPEHALYWDFFDFPERHISEKTIVCGHSSQKNGRPINIGHAICIDTWAYGKGWLTCLDVGTGHCWRSKQTGLFREDELSDIANLKSVH